MARFGKTLLILLVVCFPCFSEAAKVELAWDPPTDGATKGYIIFYGTASQSHSQQVNVGFVTSYTVTGLAASTTYYFVIRAYGATGALSEASNEVSAAIPANKPPTISLILPSQGTSFLTSTTVSIQATASDDGMVQSVTFLLNGRPFGVPDTSSPYETVLSGLAPGSYTVTAVVTDDNLATTTSAPVHFSVTNPGSRTNVALSSNGAVALASSSYSAAFGSEATNNGDRRAQSWGNGAGWNDGTPNQFPDTLEIQFNGAKTINEIDVFSVQDNYEDPVEPTQTMTFTLYGLQDVEVQY